MWLPTLGKKTQPTAAVLGYICKNNFFVLCFEWLSCFHVERFTQVKSLCIWFEIWGLYNKKQQNREYKVKEKGSFVFCVDCHNSFVPSSIPRCYSSIFSFYSLSLFQVETTANRIGIRATHFTKSNLQSTLLFPI